MSTKNTKSVTNQSEDKTKETKPRLPSFLKPNFTPEVPVAVPTATAKKTKKRVDDYTFVRLAASSKSYDELANATGMALGSVKMRHAKLRKAGVNLIKYSRPKAVIDVAALNSLLPAVVTVPTK